VDSTRSSGAFLYTLCIGLAAGVLCGLALPIGSAFVAACLSFAALFLLCGFFIRHKIVLLGALMCAALVLGALRADLFLYKEAVDTITAYAGKAEIAGTIANDPEVSGYYLEAAITVNKVNGVPAQGTALAFLPQYVKAYYGEKITATGKLEAPAAFMGDNGNTFDYPNYLRAEGVSMLFRDAKPESIRPADFSISAALFYAKHAFDASLERIFPQPDVSLLEGILLGQRRGLASDITAAFVAAGLIHIVILSGYSMSVVSEGIIRAFGFLPRRAQIIFTAACMILFVLMTGAAATTVRACAMAIVALVARYFKRTSLAMRSLAAVAAGMVLYNPPLILGDASFFASVLATFGLIAFSPSIEKMLHWLPERFDIRSIITSTIAVQIFALPALLYFTGTVSFLSVPANLLVLPLLPVVMLGGLLSGLLGFAGRAVAIAPAIVTDFVLKWILLVARVTEALPFASKTVTAFPLWLTVVVYIPLTMLALWSYRRNASRQRPS